MFTVVLLSSCAPHRVNLEGTSAPNVRIVEAIGSAIPILQETDPDAAARWQRWIETNPRPESILGVTEPMMIRPIAGTFKITAYAAPILDARRESDQIHRHAILAAPPSEIETEDLPTRQQLADGSVGDAVRLIEQDGLALYRDLVGLLATLPRLDRTRARRMADGAAARGAEARFELLLNLADRML
ncbi:MAG: hypothetical protein QMB94_09970, partial [Phycisphaerales bacterium]